MTPTELKEKTMSRCKFDGIGRLGADAETRITQSGTTLLSWRMACDRGYGDKKETEWVKCAIFGKRAEGTLGQYLKKGTLVAVRGDIKTSAYTDRNGNPAASIEVFVDELSLLGGPDSQQSNQSAARTGELNAYAQEKGGHQQEDFDDSTIPF